MTSNSYPTAVDDPVQCLDIEVSGPFLVLLYAFSVLIGAGHVVERHRVAFGHCGTKIRNGVGIVGLDSSFVVPSFGNTRGTVVSAAAQVEITQLVGMILYGLVACRDGFWNRDGIKLNGRTDAVGVE